MISPDRYRALTEGTALVDRSTRGRLMVTGADRRSYLQGLLTNDIAALGPGTGCYAAWLTPQGRMLTDMRVFELGDAILIELPHRLAREAADRLSQFIFSEDVGVEDVTERLMQRGVFGPRAPEALAAAFTAVKSAEEPAPDARTLSAKAPYGSGRWDAAGAPVYVLRGDDVGVAGFDLVGPRESVAALEQSLVAGGAIEAGAEAVEAARIEAGVPVFDVDMDEETIPLEAGIEDRAISFTKGCYVGQEIIIRVMHRGHGRVARRLVGLALDPAGGVPSRMDVVLAGDREIGRITSATDSPALRRPIALAYVHRDFTGPGTAVVVRGGGPERAAVVAPLPFVAR